MVRELGLTTPWERSEWPYQVLECIRRGTEKGWPLKWRLVASESGATHVGLLLGTERGMTVTLVVFPRLGRSEYLGTERLAYVYGNQCPLDRLRPVLQWLDGVLHELERAF